MSQGAGVSARTEGRGHNLPPSKVAVTERWSAHVFWASTRSSVSSI